MKPLPRNYTSPFEPKGDPADISEYLAQDGDEVTELDPDPPAEPAEPDVDIPEELLADASLLVGPAGTGKTYLARGMTRQLPGTVLAATTGIAAMNLGEGTTINALLGYYDSQSLIDNFTHGSLQSKLSKLHRAGVRRIILDEISMLDAQQLTVIARAMDEVADQGLSDDDANETTEHTADGKRPWPIKLVLTGDFAQLPPVKADFAFQSPEWGRFAANRHTLTTVRRQADPDFIAAIQAARRGEADLVVDYFRARVHQHAEPDFDGATIFAKNEEVDRYNMLRMDKLTAVAKQFVARRWGTQRGDWKQIKDVLSMKVGALVMILANRREPGIEGMPGRLVYANGDLGIVEGLDPDHNRAHVKLQRNGQTVDVVDVTRDNWIPLEVGRRKALKAEQKEHLISEDGRFECTGQVTYLPLRVAYGTTVHKSQGLSLDRVQINVRDGFFKAPGMFYVALSRARTAEGLRLVGSIDSLAARCTVHPLVRPWV